MNRLPELIQLSCDKCSHWIPWASISIGLLPEDNVGECTGIMGSDKVDITLRTGWSGGYVSAIETNCKFFCAEWKEKDSCKIT